MSVSLLMLILLVIANVTGAGMIVPQVARLRRGGVTDGVSATWVGVGISMNAWWIAYGVAAHRWGVVPVSVGGVLLYGAMAAFMLRFDGRRALGRLSGGLAAPATLVAAALLAGGWPAAGLTIGLLYGVQFAPAAYTAVRSPSVAGVSAATWQMAWVEAVIWLVYGASAADAALVVGGGGGVVMSSIILMRLAIAGRPRARRRAVPLGLRTAR